MKRIHIERLIKLAEALSNNQIAHSRWNIAVYNENQILPQSGTGQSQFLLQKSRDCDYTNGVAQMGNAIGQCPVLFDEWVFARVESENLGVSFIPQLRDYKAGIEDVEIKSAMRFFQISQNDFHLLFTPYQQRGMKLDGWFQLTPSSKIDEQAYNLWRFISVKSNALGLKVEIPQL